MTLSDYLYEELTSATAVGYQRAIDHFLLYCKEQSTNAEIVDYLHRFNIHLPRDISAIKKYFDYLLLEGIRTDHPCKKLTLRTVKKPVQLHHLFSSEELELLLKKEERYKMLVQRNKVLISLMIYQGLTPQNLVSLRNQDIDLDLGTVYVMATKKLTRRTLELRPNQVLALYKYIYETRVELLKTGISSLLVTKQGQKLSVDTINRLFVPLQGLFMDKNLNPTTIRKSVIANWINEQQIAIEDVQLLAGHKWLSTTEGYKIENRENKREQINRYFPL